MPHPVLFAALAEEVAALDPSSISERRRTILHQVIDVILNRRAEDKPVLLHFICTHNSRRSILSQAWAQALAYHYDLKDIDCYSGGTEATALYPAVEKTLAGQGFHIQKLSEGTNIVYSIKYAATATPVIGFSKTYFDAFNPTRDFIAIMTCSQADEGCPHVIGAAHRIAVTYEDPKRFDGRPEAPAKYLERSRQIATEWAYIFHEISIRA